MTSVVIILVGMMCLASALVARYSEQTDLTIIVEWAGGWIGSILVIVGTGKLLFVDD